MTNIIPFSFLAQPRLLPTPSSFADLPYHPCLRLLLSHSFFYFAFHCPCHQCYSAQATTIALYLELHQASWLSAALYHYKQRKRKVYISTPKKHVTTRYTLSESPKKKKPKHNITICN